VKAAFIDMDKTLVHPSAETLLLAYMLKKKPYMFLEIAFTAGMHFLKNPKQINRYIFKSYKKFLKGKRVAEIDRYCRECFEQEIKRKISRKAVSFVNEYKKKGFKIVLVTGAIEPLVKHVKNYLKADDVIATKPAKKDGKYTGEIVGLHPFGQKKAKLVREYAKKHKVSLKQSMAAGDHETDRHLLELVGRPVAVDPDPGLEKYARMKGWQIVHLK
jgi:putative phosphoserine phosphatase/1-acylglycerol-3-phosphate O-acyltransferase